MSTIITLSDLTTYMAGETLDTDRANQVIAAVNEHIESATGRSWGETQSGTEIHDFAPVIFLRHPDVLTITQVQTGQGSGTLTTLPATSYFFDDYGRLVLEESRNNFTRRRSYIHVEYTYGVVTVPADLKLAALALAADFYAYAGNTNEDVSSEAVGTYKVTYASKTDSRAGKSLSAVINSHRVRNL